MPSFTEHADDAWIRVEARYADGNIDRVPDLARELVRMPVEIIVAPATPIVRAVKEATATIPIVMVNTADPVGFGFVASLAKPGGNITGLANLTLEQAAKNLELLKEMVPKLSKVGVLVNPGAPDAGPVWDRLQSAARQLTVTLQRFEARKPDDLEASVTEAVQQQCGGLLVSTIEGMIFQHRSRILQPALTMRLPTAVAGPPYDFVRSGALMSYGASSPDMFGRAAIFVDKILKGAKPGDIPVEQPAKFQMGINLRIAAALGLKVPPSLLLQADEVIQP